MGQEDPGPPGKKMFLYTIEAIFSTMVCPHLPNKKSWFAALCRRHLARLLAILEKGSKRTRAKEVYVANGFAVALLCTSEGDGCWSTHIHTEYAQCSTGATIKVLEIKNG